MGGGQDKPAWTACPPGVKITRVGGKITRDSLPPGGQAVQGGKINCYTSSTNPDCSLVGHWNRMLRSVHTAFQVVRTCCIQLFDMYDSSVHTVKQVVWSTEILNKDLSILQFCLLWRQQVKRTVSESHGQLTTVGSGSGRVKCWDKTFFVAGQAGWFVLGISHIHST